MVQRQLEDIERKQLLQRMVIDAIEKEGCRKVKDVVNALQQIDKLITFEEIRETISELREEKKVTLLEPLAEVSFSKHVTSFSAVMPFWLTIAVTITCIFTIYLMPPDSVWSLVRIIVGMIFVLFIPGYLLIQLLYPGKEMDMIERLALSLGLSLALTALIGLILNYSPWGIRLEPMVILLSLFSITLALGGTYRIFLLRRNFQS